MFMRIVRFTDVTGERLERTLALIRQDGGTPAGAPRGRLTVLFDQGQGTAVVLQEFASAADMEEGARVLSAMKASETPGVRASVDACELMIDVKP